jgi:hypothetical protein
MSGKHLFKKGRFPDINYLVRSRLEEVMNSIEEAGDKYCGLLTEMFEGPLVPQETQGGVFLTGTLNIGHAMMMAMGSPHCTTASPTVQWSNPYGEAIHSPVKIFVPVINQG